MRRRRKGRNKCSIRDKGLGKGVWSAVLETCYARGFGVPRGPVGATGTCSKRKSIVQADRAQQHQTLCVDGSPAGAAGGGGQVLPRGMVGLPCAPGLVGRHYMIWHHFSMHGSIPGEHGEPGSAWL